MRKILSITGKPGLFKIISQGKNVLIVEDIISKKRFPAHSRDRIIALADIAMYTEEADLPLPEVMEKVYAANDGKEIDVKALADSKGLKEAFGKAVPDFDRVRVHDSDIKKLFQWYNLLVQAGYTTFTEPEEESGADEAEEKGEA